jgi:hypothetical protein
MAFTRGISMNNDKWYYKLLAAMTACVIFGLVVMSLILFRQRQNVEMADMRAKIQKLENAPKFAQLAIVSPLPPSAEAKSLVVQPPPIDPPAPVAAPTPRPERLRPVAFVQPQSDDSIKAIRIATLFKPSQVKVETGDTRIQTALRVCGKNERKLSLVVKKADDGSIPVLVVGTPAINEDVAMRYALCLEVSLPRYGGKINRVEVVPLPDTRKKSAPVAQASATAHRI